MKLNKKLIKVLLTSLVAIIAFAMVVTIKILLKVFLGLSFFGPISFIISLAIIYLIIFLVDKFIWK